MGSGNWVMGWVNAPAASRNCSNWSLAFCTVHIILFVIENTQSCPPGIAPPLRPFVMPSTSFLAYGADIEVHITRVLIRGGILPSCQAALGKMRLSELFCLIVSP